MITREQIQPLADLIYQQSTERMKKDYAALLEAQPNYCETSIKMGRKFACVDIGPGDSRSGRYMVDLETGIIYGIKGYGVVHRGYVFGTLDTIQDWYWGDYRAVRLQQETRAAA